VVPLFIPEIPKTVELYRGTPREMINAAPDYAPSRTSYNISFEFK
jgi:hypothetical protein